jgi:hypothetical protein
VQDRLAIGKHAACMRTCRTSGDRPLDVHRPVAGDKPGLCLLWLTCVSWVPLGARFELIVEEMPTIQRMDVSFSIRNSCSWHSNSAQCERLSKSKIIKKGLKQINVLCGYIINLTHTLSELPRYLVSCAHWLWTCYRVLHHWVTSHFVHNWHETCYCR